MILHGRWADPDFWLALIGRQISGEAFDYDSITTSLSIAKPLWQ
jgi:hypothetical protein